MPELPEVETVVRRLEPSLRGRSMVGVWTSGLPLRMRRHVDRDPLLRLRRAGPVVRVRRRGKYILIELERAVVLVHLGMSGRLRLLSDKEPKAPHTHVVLGLVGGTELRFEDPRRFGWVRAAASAEHLEELAHLGPDPLTEIGAAGLADALRQSRAPVKSFLLDQKRLAGLGNIYASEALFRARIHPRLPAHRASGRASALLRAIRGALTAAIRNRGTTFRDYRDPDGETGGNYPSLLVYDRQGLPCLRCRAPIRRSVDAGRSTFYCPRCQRR